MCVVLFKLRIFAFIKVRGVGIVSKNEKYLMCGVFVTKHSLKDCFLKSNKPGPGLNRCQN